MKVLHSFQAFGDTQCSCFGASSSVCPPLSPDGDHQFAFGRRWGRAEDKVWVQRDGQEGEGEGKHMTNDTLGPSRVVCFSGFPDTNAY